MNNLSLEGDTVNIQEVIEKTVRRTELLTGYSGLLEKYDGQYTYSSIKCRACIECDVQSAE